MLKFFTDQLSLDDLLTLQMSCPETTLRSLDGHTLECVREGQVWARVTCRTGPCLKPQAAWPALSTKEWQVVALFRHGLKNGEISQMLTISEKAVEKRISSILRKMGLKSRSQVIDFLARQIPGQESKEGRADAQGTRLRREKRSSEWTAM